MTFVELSCLAKFVINYFYELNAVVETLVTREEILAPLRSVFVSL